MSSMVLRIGTDRVWVTVTSADSAAMMFPVGHRDLVGLESARAMHVQERADSVWFSIRESKVHLADGLSRQTTG